MPIEGSTVFQDLQRELTAAEHEVARFDGDAAALDGRAQELLSRRGEAVLELARHFLPEISRPAIQATFEGIRADLLGILARKDKLQNDLTDQINRGDRNARERDAALNDLTGRLNALVARREELEATVAETLKSHADFQERSKLALQAEVRLHRNEQRVAEVKADAAEKLPHYDNSRLFRYLHDRHYNTPEYTTTGPFKTLDDWVARLIKYKEAQGAYEFLKKTPEMVAAEVERRRALFTELMQQVEAIQKDEADRAGLTDVLREGDELGATRDQLVAELNGARRQVEQYRHSLAELGQTQNTFYAEALERFRKFLGETRLALLDQRARQTPEPDDDAIVAEIAQLDGQIDQLGPQLADLTARRDDADRVRAGLDEVARRYRQANFDAQRSYFEDGFNPRAAFRRFRDGGTDVRSLWSELQSYQRFRPHWINQTGQTTAEVLASPAGRVILGAVLNAANHAMRDAAVRGVHRRGDVYAPPPQPTHVPPQAPPPSYSPPPSDASFTSGEGF